jgi:hypothetical protein
MYDKEAAFAGIRLMVDPINRSRREDSDNVMAIFYEEQPFTWEFVLPYVELALTESKGDLDFLDVGTGSGVFSILMAKHFPLLRIKAIDKSPRAIEWARTNRMINKVEFDLHGPILYSKDTVPQGSAKVIGLYPPYHLYPESVADKIPQHARGGSDGQEEFRNQLAIAGSHMAEDGIIFFNQMAIGNEVGPEFLEYISKLIPGASVTYTNVFAPMATRDFLQGVYGDRHPGYVSEMSSRAPLVYYCVGIIKKDGKQQVEVVEHTVDLAERSWNDRILLHKEIAGHEGN